ncbi:MAG: K+/H+ antiporter subunit F [Phycisphaerales bacterium]|nr:K+/H+ antiporter subunit F [Phycisphaerales bacterium]
MNALLASSTWHEYMVEVTVEIGILIVAVGILVCLIRLFRGPHLADRAIALDTLVIQVIGLVILLTLRINSLVLFDGALVMSLVGFTGTVAVAQYIVRPHRRRRANPDVVLKQDV